MNIGSITLNSNRLVLRRIYQEDALEIFESFVNQDEFLYWANKKKRTLQEQIDSLKGIDEKYLQDGYYNWLITLKESGKIIGSINACRYDEISVLINYAIDNRYTNNGYMSEALKVVLDYLMSIDSIKKIYCGCCIENIASKKVMEKYMNFEKLLKDEIDLIENKIKSME